MKCEIEQPSPTTSAWMIGSHCSNTRLSTGVQTVTSCVCYATLCLVAVWLAYFILACILLVRSNTPPVLDACKGFWEFMVVSITSPALIPLCYITVGMGAVSWKYFYIISSLTLAIAGLYMTAEASGNESCVHALRDTSPPEPWLLILSWIKVVAYISVSISGILSEVNLHK